MSDNYESNPAWHCHSGKFDDGILEIKAPKDQPVSTVGPYFSEIMKRHGLTDNDIFNSRCIDCNKVYKIQRRAIRCPSCINARQVQSDQNRKESP